MVLSITSNKSNPHLVDLSEGLAKFSFLQYDLKTGSLFCASHCHTGGNDCCFEPMEYVWPHNIVPIMNITVESCAYVHGSLIHSKDLGQ